MLIFLEVTGAPGKQLQWTLMIGVCQLEVEALLFFLILMDLSYNNTSW
jgi:hypothetical protein